jgi:hypothetical protein
MKRRLNAAASRVRGEAGLSTLEAVGLIAFLISLLAMIPFVREFAVNAIGVVFNQVDEETGHINEFSVAMRGFGVAAGAVLVFIGSLALVLWTDVGKRLSFLLTGAAVFGWLTINGILFVVYAPRGIRPENLEGLNAFQMRLPSIALTVGSMVIMAMFLVALTRYEADTAE